MQWDFSPENVITARADYGLADFRRDLAEEVRAKLPPTDELQERRSFYLIYDLCYALATSMELDAFLGAYAYDPQTVRLLREVEPLMAGNAEMLGAILQRLIMDRIESGMGLEQAIDDLAAWHVRLTAQTRRAKASRGARNSTSGPATPTSGWTATRRCSASAPGRATAARCWYMPTRAC